MATTKYIWNVTNDTVLMEKDGNGTTTAEYNSDPVPYGRLFSMRRSGGIYNYRYDVEGNTRALTDDSGINTDIYRYDAWGGQRAHIGTTVNPYRFVGEYGYQHNEATDAYYVRERTFQPTNARWTSADPVGLFGIRSDYKYASNNPVTNTDPSGLLDEGNAKKIFFNCFLNQFAANGTTSLPGKPVIPLTKCKDKILQQLWKDSVAVAFKDKGTDLVFDVVTLGLGGRFKFGWQALNELRKIWQKGLKGPLLEAALKALAEKLKINWKILKRIYDNHVSQMVGSCVAVSTTWSNINNSKEKAECKFFVCAEVSFKRLWYTLWIAKDEIVGKWTVLGGCEYTCTPKPAQGGKRNSCCHCGMKLNIFAKGSGEGIPCKNITNQIIRA